MNVLCTATPCPVVLNAFCVHYEGPNLVYTGINTNDDLQTALEKIDSRLALVALGTSGTSGTSGLTGSSGSSGLSGTSGTSGSSGTTGVDGTSGTSGVNGTSGIDGTSGSSGIDGTSGSSGTSGVSGTSGTTGIDGTSGTSGTSGLVSGLSIIGNTPNAEGATLTGSVLNLEPASTSFGGVVTTGIQSFAGLKTFTSTVGISGGNALQIESGVTGNSVFIQSPVGLTSSHTAILPSSTGTLALTSDITSALTSYVPYSGATGDVTLGSYSFRADGGISVGAATIGSQIPIRIFKTLTGSNSRGIEITTTLNSSVNSSYYGVISDVSTQAAVFSLSQLYHFYAQPVTVGAGSTIVNQTGFRANDLSGATSNWGFYGGLTSGTGKFNLYMEGSANNYLNGSLLIGSNSSVGSQKLQVTGDSIISGNLTANSFIKSGGTSSQFLKADGSVDGNSYALTSSLSGYLPLTAGSGKSLSGTLYLKAGDEVVRTLGSGTSGTYGYFPNGSGGLIWGIESSVGGTIFTGSSSYATVFGHTGAFPLQLFTNGTARYTIDASGNNTWTGNGTFNGDVSITNGKILSTISTLGTVTTAVQSDNTAGYLSTLTNHPLILRANSIEVLRLNAGGVAANLSTNLTINSGTTTSILNIISPGYWTWGIRGMTDRLAFYKDGTELGYFNNSNNLILNGSLTGTSGFSSYTADGLFNANASPSKFVTPSGKQILIGYWDNGGSGYFPRIGFSATSNWSMGIASDGNSFLIATGNSGSIGTGFSMASTGAATFSTLAGSGDRIVFTNSGGTLITATIGSGLSYSGGVLSATGGATGTVTGTGTAGYIPIWNSASDIGNSIILQSSSNIGIGMTPGGYKLDVNGTARFANEIYPNGVWSPSHGPGSSGGSITFRNWGGTTLATISDAGALNISASDSRITGGDGVGRLILANSSTTTYAVLYGASHATVPNNFVVVTNNSTALTINSSQASSFASSVSASSFTAGTARIISWITDSSYARFGHSSYNTSTNYGILQDASSNVYIQGTNVYIGSSGGNNTIITSSGVTSSSFSGAGTGLTGTASGLSIGGNAATWGGQSYTASQVSSPDLVLLHETGGTWKYSDLNGLKSWLGLGSAAYTASSAYYAAGSTVANSTLWNGNVIDLGSLGSSVVYLLGQQSGGTTKPFAASAVQSFLGLGSLAYSSATIPTATSQLTNDSGYITSSAGSTKQLCMQNSTTNSSSIGTAILNQCSSSSLSTNGNVINFVYGGEYAVNGNNKSLSLEIGGTTVFSNSSNANGIAWQLSGTIIRQSSNVYRVIINWTQGSSASVTYYTGTVTDFSPLVVSLVAGTATSTGDLLLHLASLTANAAP